MRPPRHQPIYDAKVSLWLQNLLPAETINAHFSELTFVFLLRPNNTENDNAKEMLIGKRKSSQTQDTKRHSSMM